VEKAMKILPTKVCPNPVVSAMPSPIFGKKMAATITITALTI
jgi:hypothetical protein